jgi:hypothetical protein
MSPEMMLSFGQKTKMELTLAKVGIHGCCPTITLFLNLIKMALGLGFGN